MKGTKSQERRRTRSNFLQLVDGQEQGKTRKYCIIHRIDRKEFKLFSKFLYLPMSCESKERSSGKGSCIKKTKRGLIGKKGAMIDLFVSHLAD